MDVKAEIRVMLLGAMEHQRFPANYKELGERQRADSPLQDSGANAANTFTSDYETVYSCCVSHLVCGTLLWQPQEASASMFPFPTFDLALPLTLSGLCENCVQALLPIPLSQERLSINQSSTASLTSRS